MIQSWGSLFMVRIRTSVSGAWICVGLSVIWLCIVIWKRPVYSATDCNANHNEQDNRKDRRKIIVVVFLTLYKSQRFANKVWNYSKIVLWNFGKSCGCCEGCNWSLGCRQGYTLQHISGKSTPPRGSTRNVDLCSLQNDCFQLSKDPRWEDPAQEAPMACHEQTTV